MKINIATFQCLDGIAHNHRIKDPEWAKNADIRRPSISELRRIAKHPNDKIGRVCTIDKVFHLFHGLHKILGGDVLQNEIMACIAKETNQDARFLLYSLILKDASKETKDAVESTMKIAAQTIRQIRQ
jgi:hypothetical protein